MTTTTPINDRQVDLQFRDQLRRAMTDVLEATSTADEGHQAMLDVSLREVERRLARPTETPPLARRAVACSEASAGPASRYRPDCREGVGGSRDRVGVT